MYNKIGCKNSVILSSGFYESKSIKFEEANINATAFNKKLNLKDLSLHWAMQMLKE